jgi:hypothetical protein
MPMLQQLRRRLTAELYWSDDVRVEFTGKYPV